MKFRRSFVENLSGGYGQVVIFVALTAAAVLAHAGSVLNYAFPFLATAFALSLFFSRRSVYVAFVWWIWLFSPLVRRLVDYQSGYHLTSPVLLAPLLVTMVSFLPLVKRPRTLLRRSFLPFLLILVTYVYAWIVGILSNGFPAATLDLATYIAPFGFGIYLLTDEKNFAENRQALVFAVTLGLLLIAAYGFYQFYRMPPWDAYWLTQSAFSSAGLAIAEQVRVFGTLNAPGPYATVLMMSLVFLLVTKGNLRVAAAGFGLVAFALTEVRTNWGGFVLAALYIAIFVGGRTRIRIFQLAFVVVLIAYPLVTVGPVADRLQPRLQSFNNIQQDGSFQQRKLLYQQVTATAFSQPIGVGFGGLGGSSQLAATATIGFDSGILQIPYQFGLVFAAIFAFGVWQILARCVAVSRRTSDNLAIAGAAIFLVMVVLNVAAPTFVAINGLAAWIGVALGLRPVLAPAAGIARSAVSRRPALLIPAAQEN